MGAPATSMAGCAHASGGMIIAPKAADVTITLKLSVVSCMVGFLLLLLTRIATIAGGRYRFGNHPKFGSSDSRLDVIDFVNHDFQLLRILTLRVTAAPVSGTD